MGIKEGFIELVNMMAPPLPDEVGGDKLRRQINAKLAPILLNKISPVQVADTLFKPAAPSKGPPLPASWGISWP